jgi:DNA polymerase
MTVLYCDFETRSRCDLPSRGVYNYAQDISTQVLCMSYAFDDEAVQTWTPRQVFPQKVSAAILSGVQIRAHNAAFERLMFWYVICPDHGVPEPALTQFYCTATQARANCAPGSLEDVGRFAGAGMRKDHRGAALVRALSIPQANGTFREDAGLMQEMIEYCEQDVRAMRAFSKAMRGLTDEELLDYHVNERINDRGVRLDRPLAQAAVKYAAAETIEIQNLVCDITQREIVSVRSVRMKDWVWDRVGPEARKLMTLMKNDRAHRCLDKTVRASVLTLAEENPDEVPAEVAEVVQCADDLWASSVAKFERAAALSDDLDSRVRGAFVFAGGSATGRASSYGLQVHNFPRKCAREPELARQALVRGHQIVPEFGKRVTDVLKSMLRPALIPAEGKSFAVFDYAQIEARVTPWLSMDGEETLDVFREGRDIYVAVAARMFNVEETAVTDEQRQLGKVAVLACGFGGGVGAFSAMGRVYGVHMPESEARRTVDLWRRANPWAVPFWSDLEQAYTRAIRNPGEVFTAGRVQYMKQGDHLWYALPSGRVLCYPYARFEEDGVSYAKASWKPAADAKEWPRARLWRGLACENIVQATANDILREALRGLDAAGVEVVLHVHDEIVAEVDTEKSAELAAAMQAVMVTPPAWAEGLPLGASGKVMQRYGK